MCKMRKSAAAVGIFDGIHPGHRLVLDEAKSFGEMTPAVFTFNTESISFKHGRSFEFIYTNDYKLELLGKLGFEQIYSPDFEELCGMDGESFAREILCGRMNCGVVVCGENFRFGHGVSCGVGELRTFGEKYGFEVIVIKLSDNAFSSERLRGMLREGRTDELRAMGFDYTLSTQVVGGNRLGRNIGFPTINQPFADGQLVPKTGVYSTVTRIGDDEYASITNIGVKPTVEKNIRPLAETHILGFSGDLYGKRAEVSFGEHIRDERKFSSVDELKKQIAEDIEYIKKKKD